MLASRFRLGVGFALSAWIGTSSIVAVADLRPSVDVVLPANLAQLDPAVQRLIRQKVEELAPRREDPEAWADLGLVYEANLLWLEARACFERAVELAPGDLGWRFHLALAVQEAGDFSAALRRLRSLSTDAPWSAPIQQHLGRALLATSDFEDARTVFSRLIEILPSSPVGYLGAADALLGLGQPAAAVPLLRQAVELEPGNRGAHHRLGLALRSMGRLDEARHELALGVGAAERMLPLPQAERVERYAVHLTARVDRAVALLALGRAEEARDLLALCLSDHPDNQTVLNNLAIAHLRLGELAPARELLDRALALNEAKFSTWINLTSWALRAGHAAQALEYADGAVARGPESAPAHSSRAQVLLRLGRPAEAAADFERAAALDARDPRSRLAAAEINRRLDRADRARDLYRQAIDLDPGLLPALIGLCRLELSQGRLEAARKALEEARRVAPSHPRVLELDRALARESGGD